MNLIIIDKLTYNQGLYFRHLTMVAKHDLQYDVLVEAEKENVDECYGILKSHGWFDFVDDFIEPQWRLEGVRIDTELNYPMTIKADQINCENTPTILGQIKLLRNV